MAIDPFNETLTITPHATHVDKGLRAYMLTIYSYMALALAMTGAIAFGCAQSDAFLNAMYIVQDGAVVGTKPLAWIVIFAPLVLVLYISFNLPRMSLAAVQISYWVYAALVGMSFSTLFLNFTDASIAQVFFVTAGTFASMSLIGYTTRRDLSSLGSLMLMSLWGLIVAMLVNLFLQSSGLQFVLSAVGVLIFVALTAYDTQKLKTIYYQLSVGGEWAGKIAVIGALTLYLDFINIFLNLLTLFGHRRK